jgi:secondary thiamine-phosphate synthase enzyme
MMATPSGAPGDSSRLRVWSDSLRVPTEEPLQFVDLTDLVAERVRRSGVTHGLVNVQTRHTTTAVLVNENEPLLLADLRELFERWAPARDRYRHDELWARRDAIAPDERRNGHSHARAVLLGTSESLNVIDGRLQLGRWQRIFLVELDGPREREVSLVVLGIATEDGASRTVLQRVAAGGAS